MSITFERKQDGCIPRLSAVARTYTYHVSRQIFRMQSISLSFSTMGQLDMHIESLCTLHLRPQLNHGILTSVLELKFLYYQRIQVNYRQTNIVHRLFFLFSQNQMLFFYIESGEISQPHPCYAHLFSLMFCMCIEASYRSTHSIIQIRGSELQKQH